MGLFDRFRKPPSDTQIPLPKEVSQLAKATDALRKHYGADGGFALSGTAVGDIGEHEACKAFGLEGARKGNAGYDAIAPDGRTVQVKSTQGGGARFSHHQTGAQHLICIDLDLRGRMGTVIYNGPEAPVRALLGVKVWNGTASVHRKKLLELDARVAPGDRLPMVR